MKKMLAGKLFASKGLVTATMTGLVGVTAVAGTVIYNNAKKKVEDEVIVEPAPIVETINNSSTDEIIEDTIVEDNTVTVNIPTAKKTTEEVAEEIVNDVIITEEAEDKTTLKDVQDAAIKLVKRINGDDAYIPSDFEINVAIEMLSSQTGVKLEEKNFDQIIKTIDSVTDTTSTYTFDMIAKSYKNQIVRYEQSLINAQLADEADELLRAYAIKTGKSLSLTDIMDSAKYLADEDMKYSPSYYRSSFINNSKDKIVALAKNVNLVSTMSKVTAKRNAVDEITYYYEQAMIAQKALTLLKELNSDEDKMLEFGSKLTSKNIDFADVTDEEKIEIINDSADMEFARAFEGDSESSFTENEYYAVAYTTVLAKMLGIEVEDITPRQLGVFMNAVNASDVSMYDLYYYVTRGNKTDLIEDYDLAYVDLVGESDEKANENLENGVKLKAKDYGLEELKKTYEELDANYEKQIATTAKALEFLQGIDEFELDDDSLIDIDCFLNNIAQRVMSIKEEALKDAIVENKEENAVKDVKQTSTFNIYDEIASMIEETETNELLKQELADAWEETKINVAMTTVNYIQEKAMDSGYDVMDAREYTNSCLNTLVKTVTIINRCLKEETAKSEEINKNTEAIAANTNIDAKELDKICEAAKKVITDLNNTKTTLREIDARRNQIEISLRNASSDEEAAQLIQELAQVDKEAKEAEVEAKNADAALNEFADSAAINRAVIDKIRTEIELDSITVDQQAINEAIETVQNDLKAIETDMKELSNERKEISDIQDQMMQANEERLYEKEEEMAAECVAMEETKEEEENKDEDTTDLVEQKDEQAPVQEEVIENQDQSSDEDEKKVEYCEKVKEEKEEALTLETADDFKEAADSVEDIYLEVVETANDAVECKNDAKEAMNEVNDIISKYLDCDD